ncbi:MAG: F5/8 type C domain protein [Chloroflexi bacterium ADurb.Bin360]|nr:MAG: F5/8 type C domain protein [Chloroflexi bacterium ADurb.Bin360]
MPTGKAWRFQQWVHTGSAYLDDYAEFTGSGDVQTFTYDALDRLMTAQSANDAYRGYSESYQYSPIGNLTYKTGQGTYTYPTSDPNSVRPHAVTSAGGHTYAYDANGNMTTHWYADMSQTLVYSAENRLASVTRNGKTTAYFYDGDGVLVKKTAYENLAAGVPATSDTTLFWPAVVTNGDTWANSGNGNYGEFAYTGSIGLRYVQLDLGGAYTVDQIKVWHYAADSRIYNNTKTQVSADGVTWYTVFDSAVSGTYPETAAGKTHTFAPRTVRYVRDYLNGSSSNSSNHWVEIEVWGNRTTVYVNALYEKDVTANLSTKYYYFGSQRIAMRRGSTLTYLHGDHLGSASLTTNASGAKVSLMRYMPYGELRVGGLSTDRQYTGQRREASLGFYDYVARQYDPALGRFLQADTAMQASSSPTRRTRSRSTATATPWGIRSGIRIPVGTLLF